MDFLLDIVVSLRRGEITAYRNSYEWTTFCSVQGNGNHHHYHAKYNRPNNWCGADGKPPEPKLNII